MTSDYKNHGIVKRYVKRHKLEEWYRDNEMSSWEAMLTFMESSNSLRKKTFSERLNFAQMCRAEMNETDERRRIPTGPCIMDPKFIKFYGVQNIVKFYGRSDKRHFKYSGWARSLILDPQVRGDDQVSLPVVPLFEGYQLIGDSQFLRLAEQILKKTRNKTDQLAYIGLCVSGQKTVDLLKRVADTFYPINGKIVLMIGTNDLLQGTPFEKIIEAFDELILHLIAGGRGTLQRLVIVTVPPVPRLKKNEHCERTLKDLNCHIKSKDNGDNIRVIDAYRHFMKTDNEIQEQYFEKYYGNTTRKDNTHLNKTGLQMLSALISKGISTII